MFCLEDLQPGVVVAGVLPAGTVTVVNCKWFGSDAVELTYKTVEGRVDNVLLYRDAEDKLEIVQQGKPFAFDGDGALFRLVSEAHRIRLAHLFDPVLAVHTSLVEPLPHQITAVYESMLPRQPLRFLLADDPGAGKTIMAGLLIKELIARGDLQRCLIVCPGSLAEQWQDELYKRFHLPFEILTNDKLESARTGNWFMETNLAIARLDKLSRNEAVQDKLLANDCRYDLVVCDEAHKMSATFFGGEVKYTKRYRLGQRLSEITRHFLLMTATPHNGKETDFQLFMALLDGDRFEGKFRDGVHAADASDLMRRMVKEKLLRFDAKPLFPKRMAYTVPYELSPQEAVLYREVSEYVREEFNRLEALQNNKRAGTVGFALTILQRRLASSPEAIYQSIRKRRERLENRLPEFESIARGLLLARTVSEYLSGEDLDDLQDEPELEREMEEELIVDQATASSSLDELKKEIETLKHLETLAARVRSSGEDRKWVELSGLLGAIFFPAQGVQDSRKDEDDESFKPSPHQKLVIFTEHRDTLNYLADRIRTFLGRPEAVVVIHGAIGREERHKTQEAFRHDPDVKVLLATDAAGEGINLQRAHLMINYDLPWNPNRLEQRFGRIHRIGQKETCHLWNLVAKNTREGEVYLRLLIKLEEARKALGGQVFDVLGKLHFAGESLRDLLIRAIRRGESPEEKDFLNTIIENAVDQNHIRDLMEDRALAPDIMDSRRVFHIREEMERADARRLQPHYIESFFLEAFKRLSGNCRQREPRRYEIKHVPDRIRQRDRQLGRGDPVLPRYERIAFEKDLISPQGQAMAAFVCPGHPLLDATLDLTLENNRDLLRRGSILVDDGDAGTEPRLVAYLEHAVRDAGTHRDGSPRTISKRLLYVELDSSGTIRHQDYAPYLDYRPLREGEPGVEAILARPECVWLGDGLENNIVGYAVSNVVPKHLEEVRSRRLELIDKTERAVRDRLTKEIAYWDHRAADLKAQEEAGKANARLNSGEAAKRADSLHSRMKKRLAELEQERRIFPLPPVLMGAFLVVPAGLLRAMGYGDATSSFGNTDADVQAIAARAREIVMAVEEGLGFEPVDREFDRLGYDIESRIPETGRLRFIEVKGRRADADSIVVTRNEILYSLNKPEEYILALVLFSPDGGHTVHYCRQPFGSRFHAEFSINLVTTPMAELLAKAEEPS